MASGEEYGPCLPPGLTPGVAEGKLSGKASPPDDAPSSYGPCLPPELVEREGGELSRTFGPALPPSDVRTSTAGEEENGEGGATVQLHVSEQEDEEAELIGPAVPGPDQQVRWYCAPPPTGALLTDIGRAHLTYTHAVWISFLSELRSPANSRII